MVTKESDFYAKNTFLHTKNETQDFFNNGLSQFRQTETTENISLTFCQRCNGRNVVVTKFHSSVRCWEVDQAQ
jgi:hypothetical protein